MLYHLFIYRNHYDMDSSQTLKIVINTMHNYSNCTFETSKANINTVEPRLTATPEERPEAQVRISFIYRL